MQDGGRVQAENPGGGSFPPACPFDLGLNSPAWREHQPEALRRLEGAFEKSSIVGLSAPTGTGKSWLALALGRKIGSCLYVCSTKQLQNQIKGDFPFMVLLEGRRNYPCAFFGEESFPKITAEDCIDGFSVLCRHKEDCLYWKKKQEALRSPWVVLNLAYFLLEANFEGGFSGWPFLVIDEADLLERQLVSFLTLRLSPSDLEEFGKPTEKDLISWTKMTWRKVNQKLTDLEPEKEPFLYRKLNRLETKLRLILRYPKLSWMILPRKRDGRVVLQPLWVREATGTLVFGHAEKTLLMSATLMKDMVSSTLAPSTFEFLNCSEASFPAGRRPVFYYPTADVIRRKPLEPLRLIQPLRALLDRHRNEKGLIHTTSYELAKFVIASLNNPRLISHNPHNRKAIFEGFKNSTLPLVLVSPSAERGLDLPYDACRFIIILKVPWGDLADPIIRRRLKSGREGELWYKVDAASAVIQQTGRGMRASDDFCVSYILDKQFGRLLEDVEFPAWWLEALRR